MFTDHMNGGLPFIVKPLDWTLLSHALASEDANVRLYNVVSPIFAWLIAWAKLALFALYQTLLIPMNVRTAEVLLSTGISIFVANQILSKKAHFLSLGTFPNPWFHLGQGCSRVIGDKFLFQAAAFMCEMIESLEMFSEHQRQTSFSNLFLFTCKMIESLEMLSAHQRQIYFSSLYFHVWNDRIVEDVLWGSETNLFFRSHPSLVSQ